MQPFPNTSHHFILACAAMLLAAVSPCRADVHEFTAQADLRAVAVDSPLTSFTEGGLGSLRFDAANDGLQLGRLMANLTGPLTETVRYDMTASASGDGDENALDFTELYLEWRPYPRSEWRWRSKIGAFYPPVSLENRAVGWQSPYSISSSAINTWIGEEVRTIGVEIAATSTGAHAGHNFDVTLLAAGFGWNDPMGILIFQRGWAIHDRQTALFGRLPRPIARSGDSDHIEFFREIDGRAGYYVGAELKWAGDNAVRFLHYDNRGDPAQKDTHEIAWLSRFDAIGARLQWPSGWTLIAQGMLGDTSVGPSADGRGLLISEYWSWFALASYAHAKHRYTARYDCMYTESTRGEQIFNSEQDADAWTVAYSYDLNEHWQFAAEALYIDGVLEQRAVRGIPPQATEKVLQLAARFTF